MAAGSCRAAAPRAAAVCLPDIADRAGPAGPDGATAEPGRTGASTGPQPETLKKRRDFLAAARARRWAAPGLVLQARPRGEDAAESPPRVGYTCSKKVGNAVARNRAKRRLREAARILIPRLGRPGWDYVLIGRAETTGNRPFDALLDDLATALDRVHAPPRQRRKDPGRRSGDGG